MGACTMPAQGASYLRWVDVDVEDVGTLQVREMTLADQKMAETANVAGLLASCVYQNGAPYFDDADSAAAFPARLAQPLADAVIEASGLADDEDDEGKA